MNISPTVPDGKDWLALIDTNQPEGQLASFPFGHSFAVTGRSMVAFGLSAEDCTTRRLRQEWDPSLRSWKRRFRIEMHVLQSRIVDVSIDTFVVFEPSTLSPATGAPYAPDTGTCNGCESLPKMQKTADGDDG
jgi:hypothetical protein